MQVVRDERGQATVFMALCMAIFLFGFFALAVDAGLLYRQKRVAQTAADAGALAAAAGESSGADITSSAQTAATQNGLTIGTGKGQASVTASVLAGGSSVGYVQVVATVHTPTVFMGLVSSKFNPMDVSASAQASYSLASNACFTALSQTGTAVPNASGVETNGSSSMTWNTTVMSDIATEGNSQLKSPNCGVQACGPSTSLYSSGSGKTGASLYAWGSGNITSESNSAPSYGTDNSGSKITTTPTLQACSGDPMAGKMPTAPTPSTCIDPSWMSGGTGGGQSYSISAGTYCNFNTANVNTLTMQPGLYIVTKTFSTNSGSKIVGSGVTIYLANGAISNSAAASVGGATPYGVGNGTTMNISAPTSGTYSGIAIWDGNSSSSTPDTFTFGGGASSTFSGTIYAPNTNLVLGNGSGTSTVSSSIVANTIMVLGGSTIQNSYNAGSSSASGGVNLAE
jgi:Flp pilus assembly protein TadG